MIVPQWGREKSRFHADLQWVVRPIETSVFKYTQDSGTCMDVLSLHPLKFLLFIRYVKMVAQDLMKHRNIDWFRFLKMTPIHWLYTSYYNVKQFFTTNEKDRFNIPDFPIWCVNRQLSVYWSFMTWVELSSYIGTQKYELKIISFHILLFSVIHILIRKPDWRELDVLIWNNFLVFLFKKHISFYCLFWIWLFL